MRLEGVEPPTFGSGIRRAANCAIASQPESIKILVHVSPSGNRTRVARVKTWYPDHLD